MWGRSYSGSLFGALVTMSESQIMMSMYLLTIQSLIIAVRCIYSRSRMYVLTYDVNVLWCQEIV